MAKKDPAKEYQAAQSITAGFMSLQYNGGPISVPPPPPALLFKEGDTVRIKEGTEFDYQNDQIGDGKIKAVRIYAEDSSHHEFIFENGYHNMYRPEHIEKVMNGEVKIKVKKDKTVAFDSVVLSTDKKEEIRAAISQHKNADKIFSEWGFEDVFEKGTAITLLFWGLPGCLAGDTIVEINRGGKSMPIRLDDLVHRFSGGEIKKGKGAKVKWDKSIPTRIRSHVNGYIRLMNLEAALVSGKKETFEVITESGRSIRATHDHPLLTKNGWRKLEQLTEGDEIICEGSVYVGGGRTKKHYAVTSGLVYHPFSGSRNRVATHRVIMEASLSGLETREFLDRVYANNVAGLSFLDPKKDAVNHINGDSTDNRLENLEVLTHEEHWRKEGRAKCWQNVFQPVTLDRVVSITPFGEEETYDLTVEGDDPNFLANGLIVHNTGKTLMAQAIADDLEAELKIYGNAEIGSSEPGGSERTIKKIFAEAREFFKLKKKPRVVLFDECDALLYDRNKVGVILGAQINALLSEIERHDGIIIFTTNRIGTLDLALERRIAAKIEFPFPDEEQRVAIWKRMIPKKAPIDKKVSFEDLGSLPLAGGNIKNAVLNAARMAAYLKHKSIKMEHFIQAAGKEIESQKAFSKPNGKFATEPITAVGDGVAMGDNHKLKLTQDTRMKIKEGNFSI